MATLDGATCKSDWTFGTFQSQDYSPRGGLDDDDLGITLPGTAEVADRLEDPGFAPSVDQQDFVQVPLRAQSAMAGTQAAGTPSELDTPTKGGRISSLLRSRSLSSLNLDGLLATAGMTSQPGAASVSASSARPTGETLSRPPSLLFLDLGFIEEKDPENPLALRRKARLAHRRRLVRMSTEVDYGSLYQHLSEEAVEGLDVAYDRLAELREALLETPLVKPTYATAGDLAESINQQLETAVRYTKVLNQAAKILDGQQ